VELAQSKTGEVTVVRPQGRIDSLTAPGFHQTVRGLVDSGANRVVVDLSDVTYISTAGLRALLMIARAIETARGKLGICKLNPDVQKLFTLSQFDSLIHIHNTCDDAVAALA